MIKKPLWDIFCQVIDNWGDAGICWRLAKQLSERGIHVRLWMDDTSPLVWMNSPDALHPDIDIFTWEQSPDSLPMSDVIIESFGCRAPDPILTHFLNLSDKPPVWINLEYLSAQAYAGQYHGLPSPMQSGPGKGLNCWFFYPGFTTDTGGLLREKNLRERQVRFNPKAWLQAQSIPVVENALRVSLFSYENKALPELWVQWQSSTTPVHLLVTPGFSTRGVASLTGVGNTSPQPCSQPVTQLYQNVTLTWLPFYTQQNFDHLLWSCDVNFVRGEDSWIRAIWAGKPFIWQPYIQDDGEHKHKLEAFLNLVSDARSWKQFEQRWNNQTIPDWHELIATLDETTQHLQALRHTLCQQPDLATSLIDFAKNKALQI